MVAYRGIIYLYRPLGIRPRRVVHTGVLYKALCRADTGEEKGKLVRLYWGCRGVMTTCGYYRHCYIDICIVYSGYCWADSIGDDISVWLFAPN